MLEVRRIAATLLFLAAGCTTPPQAPDLRPPSDGSAVTAQSDIVFVAQDTSLSPLSLDARGLEVCQEDRLSVAGMNAALALATPGDSETIYSTFDRIDGIASLFEACGDPWGMFPTSYHHITRRIIQAIERSEIESQAWGEAIVLDFARRYFSGLREALRGQSGSYAWDHYYYLADRDDVSRTRAVVVAMIAHLTLDLPYSLVAIETQEAHRDDYFVLGELMIEITPNFIEDLRVYYDTDAEDFLTGFFIGDWVDNALGEDTMVTFSYQTIRTKSWNNRWLLEQWWGGWIVEGEIYAAFWNIDGILATLDATGAI